MDASLRGGRAVTLIPPAPPPDALRAREPEASSTPRPAVIRIGVGAPPRIAEVRAAADASTSASRRSARRYYRIFAPEYLMSEDGDLLVQIEMGCFSGIPLRRRGGARRRALAGILADALDAYRAHGIPCHVNRVLDTTMTDSEYWDVRRGSFIEGDCVEGECAISAREPGLEIECPLCGRGTTMARRGRYPRDRAAAAGGEEWRRRGLRGEPRPTLQWVRPHGACEASNSHSLVLVPAGAPSSGELRDFVLARAFGYLDRIPHVYGER